MPFFQHSFVLPEADVYFAPEDSCMEIITAKISSAKHLILVQAYVLTSEQIARALIHAHRQGIQVELLVDQYALYSKGSKIDWLLRNGIVVILDHTVGIAHSKTIIIDNDCVITGSFNWTNAAQVKNAENLLVIKGMVQNQKYKRNWYKRAALGSRIA